MPKKNEASKAKKEPAKPTAAKKEKNNTEESSEKYVYLPSKAEMEQALKARQEGGNRQRLFTTISKKEYEELSPKSQKKYTPQTTMKHC